LVIVLVIRLETCSSTNCPFIHAYLCISRPCIEFHVCQCSHTDDVSSQTTMPKFLKRPRRRKTTKPLPSRRPLQTDRLLRPYRVLVVATGPATPTLGAQTTHRLAATAASVRHPLLATGASASVQVSLPL